VRYLKNPIFWDTTPTVSAEHIPLLVTCFMLVYCVAYSSTLKMEATCSSETSVDYQRTAFCCFPEDITLPNHHSEDLKSYIIRCLTSGPRFELKTSRT
jgi:hypothetical protein